MRQKRAFLKIKVLSHYGGKCVCCGESCLEFLTLDHIYENGKQHRLSLGGQNEKVYRDIARRWPEDEVQVLCFNCNQAKEYFGICPHERQRLGLPEIDYSVRTRWKRKLTGE